MSRWFHAQREALTDRRTRLHAWRQRRCNEALWNAMNPTREVTPFGAAGLDERIQRAVTAGADPNAVVPPGYGAASGQPPIGWALHGHRWDLVTWLLEHGADPHAPCRPTHPWRFAYLPSAQSHGYEGTVPAFSDALLTVAHALTSMLWSRTPTPRRAQDLAAMWRAVGTFLDHGADPQHRVAGTTGLHQVVMEQPSLAGWDVALLQRLAVNTPDEQGCTALHWTVGRGERTLAGAQRLMLAGANPHHLDHDGRSPLHRLTDDVRQGGTSPRVLQTFVEAWPDLNWGLPAPDGITPLTHLAQVQGLRAVDQGPHRTVMDLLDQHQRTLEGRLLHQALAANDTPGRTAPSPSSRARPRL